MRIRLKTDRCGAGFIQRDGEEIDLPRDEALRLVAAGQAELVREEKAIEVETIGAAEYATPRHQRPKFRR